MAESKRKTNRNRTKTDAPLHGLTEMEQRLMMAQNPFEELPSPFPSPFEEVFPNKAFKEQTPVPERVMLFGQHKGMPISEVIYTNPEYLLWLDKSCESSFHLSPEQYDQCVRRKEQIAQEKFERYGRRPYSGCPCPAMQRISELILELAGENGMREPEGMDTPPF